MTQYTSIHMRGKQVSICIANKYIRQNIHMRSRYVSMAQYIHMRGK